MKFNEIELNELVERKQVDYNNTVINVKQYLPIRDKIDLVQIALQQAEENGVYNEIKLDMYFNLYLVYLYSDIEFSEEDKEDEFVLFDKLQKSNLLNEIINMIPDSEWTYLMDMIKKQREENLNYKNTAGAVLQSLINDLPQAAAAAKDIVDSFDKEKYQEVIDFATAANGGRNINILQVQPLENK